MSMRLLRRGVQWRLQRHVVSPAYLVVGIAARMVVACKNQGDDSVSSTPQDLQDLLVVPRQGAGGSGARVDGNVRQDDDALLRFSGDLQLLRQPLQLLGPVPPAHRHKRRSNFSKP